TTLSRSPAASAGAALPTSAAAVIIRYLFMPSSLGQGCAGPRLLRSSSRRDLASAFVDFRVAARRSPGVGGNKMPLPSVTPPPSVHNTKYLAPILNLGGKSMLHSRP